MHEINDNNFFKEVIKEKMPVIVDFYSPSCGPCQELMPIMENISSQYKHKVKFVKLCVSENQETASNFGVMSIPTILFFKDGKIVEQITGNTTEEKIKNSIDEKLI